MELEIGLTLLLLILLSLLATVDMAFGQLSDVGLRRLIGENGEKPESRSREFLRQVRENRPRFFFSEHGYTELEFDLTPAADAISIDSDPLVLIRPEGEWDRPGVLDRSAAMRAA